MKTRSDLNKILSLLFIFAGSLMLGVSCQAGTIYFGSETETVTLLSEGALFRFPSEVRTISQASRFDIRPANPDSPNYALLSIHPRVTQGANEVTFILADGTTIKTKLVVVSHAIPERTDSIYEFKSKDTLVGEPGQPQSSTSLSELELMKAMLRGDGEVSGYEVRDLVRTLSPGFKGITAKLVRIYTGGEFNGYIFELSNVTRKRKLFVNIANLVLGDPNVAVLSEVDQAVLGPEGSGHEKTYLRIVAKASSVYNQLVLPVQVADKKEGA